MTFTKAEEKDYVFIEQLEKECFVEPWSTSDLVSLAKHTDFVAYVCYKEGVFCGYILASCNPWEIEILRVAVKKEYRKNGIGGKFIEILKEYSKGRKFERMLLEVRSGNFPAISLYRSMGFTPIAVRKKYYENTEDAIIMEFVL